MPTEGGDPLPGPVREALAGGNPHAAGELLLDELELLARREPSQVRHRVRELQRAWGRDPRFGGYVAWACGAALHVAGDPAAARPLLEGGAVALSRAGDTDAADRCRLLLIDLYGELQDIERARRLARRLVRRFEDRGDPERAAVALANLGCAEDAVDRIARAEALWRRALDRLEEGDLRRTLVEGNLANVSALKGAFAEAASLHRKVEAEAERRGMTSLALQARLNLAETEFAAGALDRAFELWHGVIGGAEALGAEGLRVAAEVGLAAAELELGDLAGAGARAKRILPAARDAGLEREALQAERLLAVAAAARGDGRTWRELHASLGRRRAGVMRDLLLAEVGQLDRSVPSAELARAARRLARQGLTVRAGVALAWAARRALDQGRPARATVLSREVLDSRVRSPWARMVAAHTLARASKRRRVELLARAVDEASALHGRLRAPADRAAFARHRAEVYADLVEALIESGKGRDRRRALDVLAGLRDSWVLEELSLRSDRAKDPLLARWQDLRRRLSALLLELEGDDEPRLRASGLQLGRRLAELERETRTVELELVRSRPVFPSAAPVTGVADRLLGLLPQGHVFVEYFAGRRDLFALVAAGGRLRAWKGLGVSAIVSDLLGSVRFHMDAATLPGGRWRTAVREALRGRLRELSSVLLEPLRGLEWDVLWVAPHDGLFHLPWPALEPEGGGVLTDRGVLTLVPGAKTCAWLLEEPPRGPRSFAVLASGADGLPWVRREAQELGKILKRAEVVHRAAAGDLLAALARHELVHLAGHALFLDGLPWASGLRLEDGFVTAHDLAASRLSARVVSFGVCSGLRLGEDGGRFGGFLQALVTGGVRTMVGPITPVEDEMGYTFDVAWARELRRTGDPGLAFANAVRALRELDDDPAVWGSFQLYGDPRTWGTR